MNRLALSLSTVFLLVALAACGGEEEPPPTFPVTFTATSDGEPLAGVRFTVAGSLLGETGPNGELQQVLTGPEGARVRVVAECPAGYRQPGEQADLLLRRVVSLDPSAQGRGIERSIVCPPLQRLAAVLIHTHGRGELPVFVDGVERGRTDRDGVAHFLMEMAPTSSFTVRVDTSSQERLRPQSPTRTFTVEDTDRAYVFDPTFQEEAPPRRRRRRRRPAAAAPSGPTLPVRIPTRMTRP